MDEKKVKRYLVWAAEELNSCRGTGRENALYFLRRAVCEMRGCRPMELTPRRCSFCGGHIDEARK